VLPEGPGAGRGEVALTAGTDALATELLAALDANGRVAPLTDRVPGFDLDAAYRVGAEILRRRRARGEKPVGRKVGFTNRTIWPEYGVFAPVWGFLYDGTVTYQDGPAGGLAIGRLAQPRIEPEVVLHFRSAPRATEDDEELLANIDWIAHGFEIVQSHFPGWKFRAADTVAAFGLHGALVVGPRRPVEGGADLARALRTFSIALARNGRVEAQGSGGNVLGSPLRAAAHLLKVLESQPAFDPIQAGELVTTGTLTRALPIQAGETWSTELSGIDLPGLQLRLE
jgi:2-keto-4-pentenoate hydratase